MKYEKIIKKYINEELTHLKDITKKVRTSYLRNFFLTIDGKAEFNKKEIIRFFNSDYFKSKSIPTQNHFKIILKPFIKWKGITVPNNIFKKHKEMNRVMKKSELLTKEEIKKALRNLNRPVEKAIFMLLLELKCRKGELIELKIGDITFYDSYAIVYIRKSKTAQRNIPIVESIPYIMRYLEDHPFRDDPNSYLFLSKYGGKYRKYCAGTIDHIFINKVKPLFKKRVYPHLLRHTGLTEMAKHLNEYHLRQIAGWTAGSRMANVYVHLASEDLENKILELHNIKQPQKDDKVTHYDLLKCPRCDYTNTELDKFCSRCGSVLDINIALEHQEKAKELEEIISKSEIRAYIDKLFEEKFKIVKN